MLIYISILILLIILAFIIFLAHKEIKSLVLYKSVERSLKMIPLIIKLPAQESSEGNRDTKEANKEFISKAESIYITLSNIGYKKGLLTKQKHITFEIVAQGNKISFYVLSPQSVVSLVQKAIKTAYPDAQIIRSKDHNIFRANQDLSSVTGGEFVLSRDSSLPLNTYKTLDQDPLESILGSMINLDPGQGVVVQLSIRPADKGWTKGSISKAKAVMSGKKQSGYQSELSSQAFGFIRALIEAPFRAPTEVEKKEHGSSSAPTSLDQKKSELMIDKSNTPPFATTLRILVNGNSKDDSAFLLKDIVASFSAFNSSDLNKLKFNPAKDIKDFTTRFVIRYFSPFWNKFVLTAAELASLLHLPKEDKETSARVNREAQKEIPAPNNLANNGIILGSNIYNGKETHIRLTDTDRRRHMYILGQTGTGKSALLKSLILQDIYAGKGFCFIDPHGDAAEDVLRFIPEHRIKDVIYFNPSDMEMPIGFNILGTEIDTQKDFIIQETISMLYKLYDPNKQGIIGPRYEHWYRHAALTVMSEPGGGTFIEIPKVFTDDDFLKYKFKFVKGLETKEFWTQEMGQTDAFHKSEMLGWFVSKFGAFASNEMIRNIIGQKETTFNIRNAMDEGKIFIVNLSKGSLGEMNAKLLGIIMVIKIQVAAMSRADTPEHLRRDFTLYVDEFQNFATDAFASILAEARKYRLSLIVANQYIGQLQDDIKAAIFGNVGSKWLYRVGQEDAEFVGNMMAPTFSKTDVTNMPNLHAAVQIIVNDYPSVPFTAKVLFPSIKGSDEVANRVKDWSRRTYGKPRTVVEKEIFDYLTAYKRVPLAPTKSATSRFGKKDI